MNQNSIVGVVLCLWSMQTYMFFLPSFQSAQRSRLYPLQRAHHHVSQRVLGRAQAGQRHHRGLPPGVRALHARRW